jgi:hypothetical protein
MRRERFSLFRRFPRWSWILAGIAAVALVAWRVADNQLSMQRAKRADARAWNVQGPPCPPMTEAQFLGGRRPGPQRFDYEGIAFFRRRGPARCATVYEDGGRSDRGFAVCEFARPDELLVRTEQGNWYFRPGPGQAATVSMADGVARCVMGRRAARG